MKFIKKKKKKIFFMKFKKKKKKKRFERLIFKFSSLICFH